MQQTAFHSGRNEGILSFVKSLTLAVPVDKAVFRHHVEPSNIVVHFMYCTNDTPEEALDPDR